MRAWRRLRNLWRAEALERDFDDEIAFHFEQRIARNLAAGMTRGDAELEARRHFGSVVRAREGMRQARIADWVPAFGRDMHVALRSLRRQPALAALAVLTLSLGVGAVAAVFALADALLLRPLPYADADRLVAIVDTFRSGPPRTTPTIPELLDLRDAVAGFDAVSFVDARDFQLGGGTEPARVVGARSEASFLRVLGVVPALGRLFSDNDGAPGAAPVAILTDGLWRANFGADRGIIGRRITLNGQTTEVVGVLPAGFAFDFISADPVSVYVPFPMIPVYTSRAAPFAGVRRVMAVGRITAGVSYAHADVEVRTIGERIAAAHPEVYRQGSDRRDMGLVMRAERLQDFLFGGSRNTMRLISVAVALLLMIACVNMGQFLLAQAVERRAELAVRGALGATRGRLTRQLAAESTVLAAVTAVTGLVQGALLIRLLQMQVAARDPFVATRIDMTAGVFLSTIALAFAVTLLCNAVPLLFVTRPLPLQALATRDVAPRTSGRHVLIAAQVAVAVTLLGMAALLVHSITRLESGDRGYAIDDVMTMRLRVPLRVQGPGVGVMYRQYLEQIRTLPDVNAVAMADAPLPLWPATTFAIEGAAADAATLSAQQSGYCIVSPDYFRTLGIPLRAGRFFTDRDDTASPLVAIVSEQMATTFWPGRSPIGRRIRAGEGPRAAEMTIVGVVGNVRPALQLEPMPQIYVSYLQQSEPNMMLLIRARTRTGLPVQAIKRTVWSVASDQPLFDVRSLADRVTSMTAEPRRSLAVLLGTSAVLAVLISGAGLFTLITYVTVRRRREIALRRVIGADIGDVMRLLTVPTLRWTAVGLLAGFAGTAAGGAIMRSTYAGIAPDDPALSGLVTACYLVLALGALCAPAVTGLREDPAAILRAE